MNSMQSQVRRIGIALFTLLILFALVALPNRRQAEVSAAQCPPIAVAPGSIPGAALGVTYSQSFTAAGGQSPYTFSRSAGTLPPGLFLGSNGSFGGTPNTLGIYNFTIRATDANGCTGTRSYFMLVVCPSITLNPGSLPTARPGQSYSQHITATNGDSPYTFSLASGQIPPGMLFGSNGYIGGTPTTIGAYNFLVRATDSNGCSGQRAYTIFVVCSISLSPVTVPDATIGVPYFSLLSSSGGQSPYTYAITSGALPAGLSLSTSNGAIGGTPTATGSSSFTVRVTDANGCTDQRTYTIDVRCPENNITPGRFDVRVGAPFSRTLNVSGGPGPHTFSFGPPGAPPSWLSISASGVLSGTPTTSGSFTFGVRAVDANNCIGAKTITINVFACSTITINPATLPSGTVGAAYSRVFSASGGTAPYLFGAQASALPPGLTLNTNGTLSGTPTTPGSYPFIVRGNDANGCFGERSYTLVMANPVCPTITINPPGMLSGRIGEAYSWSFSATGGQSPYAYSISAGTLPTGLTLTPNTISGTPTQAGSFPITLRTTDANGCIGERSYTLIVYNQVCPTITVNPATLPNGTVGAAYSQTLSATGGTAAYSFSVTSGTLPPGLSLATNGALTGTPTSAGSYNFRARATDANGCTGERGFTITIHQTCPTISIYPSALISIYRVGIVFTESLTAGGGTGPYVFNITAGALPPGVILQTNGDLTGTPITAGAYSFTVRATDANLCVGTRNYTMTINSPVCPTITINPTSSTLPSATVGIAYSQTFTGSGGVSPYKFRGNGTVPPGLTPTQSGNLSGTPTAPGSYAFTVIAEDANGCTGERSYTLVVNAPACPAITINQSNLPAGIVGAAYSQTLTATGGVGSHSFSISGGNFPAELMLNSTNGAILGTPTTAGVYSFTVRATDANGCVGERGFTLAISANLLTSVSAASFIAGGTLAPESIVATFGANLGTSIQVATTTTLPTELNGVSLKVKDSAGVERLSPLFFVSPTQINHQMPAGTALGTAVLTLLNGANVVATGSVEITNVAPGLFSADASGRGLASAVALRVRPNGLQSFEPVVRFDAALGKFVAEPIDVGNPLDQVFLVFYGTGWKLRSGLAAVSCSIGGVTNEVLYAGEVPGFVGYDQLNAKLSPSLAGLGEVDVVITVDGKTANTVRVAFR